MSVPASVAFECFKRHFAEEKIEFVKQHFGTPLPIYVGREQLAVLDKRKLGNVLQMQFDTLKRRNLKARGVITALSQSTARNFQLSAEWKFFSACKTEEYTENVTYYVRDCDTGPHIEIIEVTQYSDNSPCVAALKSTQYTDGGLV